MITVYVANETALVSDEDGQKATAAIGRQMAEHVGPAWGVAAVLHYVPRGQSAPADAWVVRLVGKSDEAGALGYHEDQGRPSGIVGVQTCIDDGVSWTSCLSHEVLELCCDPEAVRCFQVGGEVVALEIGDAAEGYTYEIDGVEVQDFVLPAYFTSGAPGPYSYTGKLTAGYPALGPGGYNSHASLGQWGQTTAMKARASKLRPRSWTRRGRRTKCGS